MDTWNQLYSEVQKKHGVLGAVIKTPQVIRIMMDANKIKNVYQRVSLDRTIYLTALNAQYKDMTKLLDKSKLPNYKLTDEEVDIIYSSFDNIIRVVKDT